MSTNRQPAGTSVGGQWAPGAAGEVDDSLDVADDRPEAEEFLDSAPTVPMTVTHEMYDDQGYSDTVVDITSEEVDASEWAHTQSIDDLEQGMGDLIQGGDENSDAVYHDLQASGRAKDLGYPFRASVDEESLREYVEARKSAGLHDPVIDSSRVTPEYAEFRQARGIMDARDEVHHKLDALALDGKAMPSRAADEMSKTISDFHERMVADSQLRGYDTDSHALYSIQEAATAKSGSHERRMLLMQTNFAAAMRHVDEVGSEERNEWEKW